MKTLVDTKSEFSPGRKGRRISNLYPLRFLIRYSLVLWSATLIAIAEVVTLLQRGAPWRGDPIWTIDWIPVSFILVAPILSGFSAMDTARIRGFSHLPRGLSLRTPAIAIGVTNGVVAGSVHLVITSIGLGFSRPEAWDSFIPLALVCQVLMLCVFSFGGVAIGQFFGPVQAGIIAALAAIALVYAEGTSRERIALLEFGGETVPRIGYRLNPQFLWLQALCLILVVLSLTFLWPTFGRGSFRVSSARASAAMLLAVSAALLLNIKTPRLIAIDVRPTYCGHTQLVQTCFYVQHERVAEAFQEQLWALFEVARNEGYEDLIPSRVEEASRTRLPQAAESSVGPVYVMPEHLRGAAPTSRELVLGLVQPIHCPQTRTENPPSEKYWLDLETLVDTWVALVDPSQATQPSGERLSPTAASTLLRSFRTCSYSHF